MFWSLLHLFGWLLVFVGVGLIWGLPGVCMALGVGFLLEWLGLLGWCRRERERLRERDRLDAVRLCLSTMKSASGGLRLPRGMVWVLALKHELGMSIFAYIEQQNAWARLFKWARDCWYRSHLESDPPPEDEYQLVKRYFSEGYGVREGYSMLWVHVNED